MDNHRAVTMYDSTGILIKHNRVVVVVAHSPQGGGASPGTGEGNCGARDSWAPQYSPEKAMF